jgi:beta-glucosidase
MSGGGRRRIVTEADEVLIARLLSSMTIEEKIGQMFQPDWRRMRPTKGTCQRLLLSVVEKGLPRDSLIVRVANAALSYGEERPLDADAALPIQEYHLGSVLGGGGAAPEPNTASEWRLQAQVMQEAATRGGARVPLLIANDSVHGQNNLARATIFPHHIGQGCMRESNSGGVDTALVRSLATVAARESRACGVNWAFSPCVAVPQDLRWGRTYEGFSEDTGIVAACGEAEVLGLQEHGVAACLKHWVGDGGTQYGTGTSLFFWSGAASRVLDQGNTTIDEATLREKHVAAYLPGLKAGALTVMASYSSWKGTKLHAHRYLLTNLLKEELGFDGLVVSDYNALNHLDAASFSLSFAACINAGIDMVMTAGGLIGVADTPFETQIEGALLAAASGAVAAERIDDAVRRILRVKVALGLLKGSPDGATLQPAVDAATPTDTTECIGCASHREIARSAVRSSLVMLKNERDTLPLQPSVGEGLVVTGSGADDLGMQCGGWTITWLGQHGNDARLDGTSVWAAVQRVCPYARHVAAEAARRPSWLGWPATLRNSTVALIVVGESPYAEGTGDTHDVKLSASDAALISSLADGNRRIAVLVICGRPLVIPPETLDLIDSLIVGWLPGTEGDGIADVLFGLAPVTGRLSFSWPRHSGHMTSASRQAGDNQNEEGGAQRERPLYPLGFGLSFDRGG